MPEGGRESEVCRRFLGQAHVAELAIEQHAVFDLDQLRALGLSARGVQQRAGASSLHRVYHAVYSLVPPELLNRNGRYMAAVLACGAGAVVSHRCAAVLLELRSYDGAKIDITVPARSGRRHAGLRIHRSTTLTDADVTRIEGVPCTTVARTLIDLAGTLTERQLERTFDQAEILRVLDLRAIEDQLRRNPTRPGVKLIRSVLEAHYIGGTPTWSELEEAFLQLVRAAGLPLPEVNVFIDPHDGEPPIRVDFVWREQRVVVETDGYRTHRTRQQFERDRRNDQRLTAAGWRSIRTTWRQVMHRPHELAPTLVALVRL